MRARGGGADLGESGWGRGRVELARFVIPPPPPGGGSCGAARRGAMWGVEVEVWCAPDLFYLP